MTITGTSTIVFPKLDASKDKAGKTKRTHVCNIPRRSPSGAGDLLVRHERTLHSAEQLAIAAGQQLSKASKSPGHESSQQSLLNHAESEPDNDVVSIQKRDTVPCPNQARTESKSCLPSKFRKAPSVPTTPKFDPHTQHSSTAKIPMFSKQIPTAEATAELEEASLSAPTSALGNEAQSATGLDIADFTIAIPDLNKLRTFPSSVSLPDLDGGLEFLDFFDPFLGLPPKQVEALGLPALNGNADGWSPLENFSASSQTSMQDYGFQQCHARASTEPSPLDSAVFVSHAPGEPASCDDRHNFRPASSFTGTEKHPNPELPQTVSGKSPTLIFTEQMRTALLKDLSNRLSSEQLCSFRLPSAAALSKCLRTYAEAFHVHLPIFHFHTMDFERLPSPLVLAICAIGALYRLERKVAASLYLKADQGLSVAVVQRGGNLDKKPRLLEDWTHPPLECPKPYRESLWESQTRLLLAMFSAFSGDIEVISKAIVHLGDFLIDYRELAPSMKPQKDGLESLSWQEWVERESVKRLLYGHIMFGNLVTMTYGIPPGYSIISDGYIEMPWDQNLWDAPTAEGWNELWIATGKTSPLTLRDAVSKVMYGDSSKGIPEECWLWSPFAISVVINAVSIQVWHITQGSHFFGEFSGRGRSQENPKSQILTQTEAALSRCRALITQARSDADYAWADAEGPLLFNCLALLRVSYCRAFTGIGAADSMILLKESRGELLTSIEEFVVMAQDRNDLVTRAVSRAFEGMLIPYKSGTLLIRKTAALTWGVGHALAGWNSALLVTKWVHAIEAETRRNNGGVISELEAQTMQSIRDLLVELEDDSDTQVVSLAAKLARHWAGFYDDTWVWGVTPRMGWVLRELAHYYENDLAIL
ncbi:uncharacterized protein Z518_06374 [Rhinocladiella mackenziei CBS 650.93]|uniref:Xylanolytic transcriptional activator regulatory domain-containing protein n=1 Tax=Rhinocladiella mackenziei CBS 650.93 TaxID=1442369 RepID=A0A0D2FTW1_9EURO|nr:uncharacterized protein Z518_06374 [Rhinocladiella mackenziei CBS 650.93]KIX05502.1 hypothetical protein Z518_06374 [Rhinocladiella mackenziei CBS 650.93]